ncbi:LOW QUALITY PROTEIN: hypothetical protein V1477_004794 [Vespula maculifrons]|uniref:Uncharacterized protein n=1 Tax=Vespula maculifrons TaxID=7453 RepID=A0ABD2CMT3_VESMC
MRTGNNEMVQIVQPLARIGWGKRWTSVIQRETKTAILSKIDSIHRHRYTFEVHYVAMIPLSALTRTHLNGKEKWKRYKARNDGAKKLLISDYARICWLLSKKLYRVLPFESTLLNIQKVLLVIHVDILDSFCWSFYRSNGSLHNNTQQNIYLQFHYFILTGISNLNNGALIVKHVKIVLELGWIQALLVPIDSVQI